MPKQKKGTTKEKEKRTGKVYKITSPTGRVYIGSTSKSIEDRLIVYRKVWCKSQHKIFGSLKKHGPDKHIFEILWEGAVEDRFKMERYYGDLFNVLDRRKGLNLKLPGYDDVPTVYSADTVEKIRASRKLVPSTISEYCHSRSVEIRSITVNSYDLKGNFLSTHKSIKQASRDTKVHTAQIRLCCIDEAWSAKGYQFRYKKDDLNKGIKPYVKNPNAKRRAVDMYDEKGNYIKTFNSVTEAGNFIGHDDIVVYKSCKQNGKLTNYGFRFKYKK